MNSGAIGIINMIAAIEERSINLLTETNTINKYKVTMITVDTVSEAPW